MDDTQFGQPPGHQERLAVLKGVEQALEDHARFRAPGIVRVETPEGPVAVIGPVIDRLVASGHLVQRADGIYHGPSKLEVMKWVEELAVCDFCAAPQANHIIELPDFDMKVGRSVGGWAACDICNELILKNDRQALLQRAMASFRGGKYSAGAVNGLHKQFWQIHDEKQEADHVAQILNDYLDDKLPNVTTTLTEREKRLELVARLTGVTRSEVKSQDDSFQKKLIAWRKRFGKEFDSQRLIEELLRAEYRKPLAPGQIPHWERALSAKFDALSMVAKRVEQENKMQAFNDATDLNDPQAIRGLMERAEALKDFQTLRYKDDAKFLRVADTYSFNAETIGAIREAAKSIPHESPLSSIEAPNSGAGWFWFADPLPFISSSVFSNRTHALLWGWIPGKDGTPTRLMFSAYVLDEREENGHVLASTRWYWPLELSLHQMLAYNAAQYRQEYGPGGKLEHAQNRDGEEITMNTITELSLFFVAACVWFKQKILVPAAAHVERHARKRYQREHKLNEPPKVQIVALRASMREEVPHEASGEPGTRNYTCRWIVKGHPRLQPVGPGRSERKLIWIDPHPAGPSDKPLRTREKVYAVIR